MIRSITYDDTMYQLVPKEPTREMVEASYEVQGYPSLTDKYKAMLSAAPIPPAQPEAVRVPLTDEQIKKAAGASDDYWASSKLFIVAIARAIEDAHGITAAAPKEQS